LLPKPIFLMILQGRVEMAGIPPAWRSSGLRIA